MISESCRAAYGPIRAVRPLKGTMSTFAVSPIESSKTAIGPGATGEHTRRLLQLSSSAWLIQR